ncbi:MAG: hemolysin family protein [Planctomycetes bacterium]|nr:hemolysin family protein [Planctomycetota bacterium]
MALNGLLAGAEMAVVTVRSSRLRELVEAGRPGARSLVRLRERPERFLATVQVGITLVGAIAAAYGGSSLADDLAATLSRWGLAADTAESVAFAVVVAAVTGLSVVLGELVPKSLALRSSERFALLVARPLNWLAAAATPLVWLLTAASNLVLKPFGDSTTFTESRLSGEEIRSLVDEASQAGTVNREAGKIASRALDLGQLAASDVMVHRRFVKALARNADPETQRRVFLEAGHRRLPVYDGMIDNVVGYMSWRDVVECLWEGRTPVVADLMRAAPYVPETMAVTELLQEMQRKRQHIAFVVDEHGGFSGIVTLEDLLEELVGEIVSEHDEEAPPIRADADGSALVQGTTALRDVDRELSLELDKIDDSTTLGGLCVALAGGRVPRAGELLAAGEEAELEIIDASPRRVRVVRVRRRSPEAPAAA